jgi:hypothetical protein
MDNGGRVLEVTKFEVAEIQLRQALKLFLHSNDYVCATTLAGAAEEILGKLLEGEGKGHSLGDTLRDCVSIGQYVFNEKWPKSDMDGLIAMLNGLRNSLKHCDNRRNDKVVISHEAAVAMLDRAVENYWRLTERELPEMREFLDLEHNA